MAIKLKSVPPELESYLAGYRKAYGHQKNWPDMANTLMTDWIEKNKRQDILVDTQPTRAQKAADAVKGAFTPSPAPAPAQVGVPFTPGQIPQQVAPLTAQGDVSRPKALSAAETFGQQIKAGVLPSKAGVVYERGMQDKGDLQLVGEAVPKFFMNASSKLGAAAIRLAPAAIATATGPAGMLLMAFTPQGKALQALSSKEANKVVEYWRPSEADQKRLADAGVAEKVAYGLADFIGQYPQFAVAGALGGQAAAGLAKSLGTTADVILKAAPLVQDMAGNAIGFGGKGFVSAYGETGDVREATKAGAGEATMMGLLPLNRLFPAIVQPLTAAGTGFGLGLAQTGDIKEATTQGLMFLAMEMPGMMKHFKPADVEILKTANTNPTPENITKAQKIILNGIKDMTPEQFNAQKAEVVKAGQHSPEEISAWEADFNALQQAKTEATQAQTKLEARNIDKVSGLRNIEGFVDTQDAGIGKRPKYIYALDVEAQGAHNFGEDRSAEGDAYIKKQANFAGTLARGGEAIRRTGSDEMIIASDNDITLGRYQNPEYDVWIKGKGIQRGGGLYVTKRVELMPGEKIHDALDRMQATPGQKVRPTYSGEPISTREEIAAKLLQPPAPEAPTVPPQPPAEPVIAPKAPEPIQATEGKTGEVDEPAVGVVYRTEKAHKAYKGKSVWGEGKYYSMDEKQAGEMQIDPHRETVEEWTPETGGVDKYSVGDLKIKTIDIENMSTTEFNAMPRGNELKKQILSEGYDAVLIKTGGDLNMGGDQLVVYRNGGKITPAPATPLQNATPEAVESKQGQATVETFRKQAIDAGWKQEEVAATLGLINARAKARGETPEAWMARNNITIEKGGEMGPGALKQSPAQPFYSKLRKVIDDKMPNSADVKSLNGLIAGAGVKNDELTWSGIKDFLDGKEKVSKAELLKYLDENQVEVKEVVKGSDTIERKKAEEIVKKAFIKDYSSDPEFKDKNGKADTELILNTFVNEIREETERQLELKGDTKTTKFSQYQLPGGENYREVLVTMPGNIDKSKLTAEKLDDGRYQVFQGNKYFGNFNSFGAKSPADAINKAVERYQKEGQGAIYKSAHFSEPNILLHLRLNDRTTTDGKDILFAEEIQSDWHQKGREEGYRREIEALDKRRVEIENKGKSATPEEKKEWTEIKSKLNRGGGVADAPFSKTWHEQGVKRMLRNAAESGKDGIGWTTGEQQAERYDLSKQVSRIEVSKITGGNNDGMYMVTAEDLHGKTVIEQPYPKKELSNVIGKELADKSVAGLEGKPSHTASGLKNNVVFAGVDLKVGGEGMKGFYDKILVDYANKQAKKYGGAVQDIQLKDAVVKQEKDGWYIKVTDSAWAGPYPTEKEARTVHYLPITDAMRSDLTYVGQELFQKDKTTVKGSAEFPSGQTIIRAFEKADVSTLSHELAHVFRRDLLPAELTAAEKAFGVKGGNWNVAAEERFANGFEEYLRTGKAPTAELKTVFEKFKAWLTEIYQQARAHLTADQTAFYDQMLGKVEAPAKPGKPDAGTKGLPIFEADKQAKADKAQTAFADLMIAIETPKENWQAVQDALRYNTPEEAQQSLKEQGIDIAFEELKKAEPMIKGGAGVRREFQMSVAKGIQSVVGNMDKRIEELAAISPEYKKQISEKFKQWEASDIREADQSVKDMMDWAGVEALPGYLETVTPDKIDMTLHHEQMAKLIDNVSPADLRAVERMMGKDAYTFAAAGQRLFTEAQAAAKTLNLVIEKYDKTEDAVEKAKLEKLGTALLNSAVDNYGLYRNAMTNGGRLVEYAKQNKKGDAYSDLVTFDKMMQSGEFSQFTEDNIVDAFKRIKQSKSLTIDGIAKAAEPTLMDKINEWQKAIKLTNPKTHIVNFSSNIANGFYNANIEKMLTVAIDAAGTIAGKPRTVFSGEVEAGWRAGIAAKSVATAKMLEALKNDLPNQRAWETQYNLREAIPGKAGKIVRTPFRLLNASDQYFFTINYNVALGQEVYADLYKQGKRGQKLWDEWKIKMNAPKDAQITTAKDKANEWLYREKLDPANQAAQKILKDAPALQFILPFYKTPVNIAKWAYRRTPILGLPGRNMADIKTGGRQAREAIARQVAGAAVYGTVAALWTSGAITGPAPDDEDKRAEFYRQGKIPYGIKIGSKYFSYGRWEPLTTITKVLTSTLEAGKQYTKDKSRGLLSAGGRAIGNISQSLLDQSYLVGLSNMFDAVNDPVRSGQRFITSTLLGATIPTGVGYLATAGDKTIRQPQGLIEQAKTRIPGLSQTVEPKLGVLGETLYREDWRGRLQPLVVATPSGNNYKAWEGLGLTLKQVDFIEQEIDRLDTPIPYPNKYYKDEKGNNKRFTPGEYNRLLKIRRGILVEGIEDANGEKKGGLKNAMFSKGWETATDEQKQDLLKSIYEKSNKLAKKKLDLLISGKPSK